MKENYLRKENEWKQEKENLTKKIEKLDEEVEAKERKDIRNNIVIKNVNFPEIKVKEEVEKFLKDKLNKNVCILQANKINERITVAKMESWTQKRDVMNGKNMLKGTQIYIDNELTKNEAIIQKQLRDIAKEEQNKGKEVKLVTRS